MINGNEYAWEDVQVVIQGKSIPIDGITEIEYTPKKEHENIRGRGSRPVAMGRGQEDFEGSITLLQSEVEAMQKATGQTGPITRLAPFQVTCSYAPAIGTKTTDVLEGCRVLEFTKKLGTEDTHMKVQLKLKIFNIKFGVR